MSDDELREACTPSLLERALDRHGCATAVGSTTLLTVGFSLTLIRVSQTTRVFGATLLSFLAATALVVASVYLLGLRRARLRSELGRRYGASDPSEYLREMRAMIALPEGPSWSLLLTATALPHGGHQWVRVNVWEGTEARADVEVRVIAWDRSAEKLEHATMSRGTARPAADAVDAILALLADPGAKALSHLDSQVFDGMPCSVHVVGSSAPTAYKGSCNLGGLPENVDHPTVRFARCLLDLARLVPGPELLAGWCSPQGKIGIGTMIENTAEIFVTLLEENVSVYRPVKAVALGDDIYKIVSEAPKPDEERWEYTTGDVVRCRVHRFEGGETGLLAVERVVPGNIVS